MCFINNGNWPKYKEAFVDTRFHHFYSMRVLQKGGGAGLLKYYKELGDSLYCEGFHPTIKDDIKENSLTTKNSVWLISPYLKMLFNSSGLKLGSIAIVLQRISHGLDYELIVIL